LAAFDSTHVDGIAQQDEADFALVDELFEGGKIGPFVGSFEVRQALGGDPERIADGHADTPLAKIQSEDAGIRRGQAISL